MSAYRQTEAQSRTPLELVVMLYDGALRFLAVARDAVERKDIHARRDAISRVLAIISELQSTLDMDRGGTLAADLDGLYGYITRRVMDAALHNDTVPLDDARRLIETLRDGWQTIAVPTGAATGSVVRSGPSEGAM
ncbi:MAG: flagellar export chaperone FliS [Acidobacteria bacterium RIFCSPLOWO2_12_FULL_67_14b]|nr:MAG: flagellar export chaperone FliS [Acidobacteria bacterium RIFCSPLOWO2_12_FULL_67_14b]